MSKILWPGVHFGNAETPLPDPRPDPIDGPDDAELAVTPPDVVALLGFDPLEWDAPAITKAADPDRERTRREAEHAFVAAWLAWWRAKLAAIDAPNTPDAVPERFRVTADEQTHLAHLLHHHLRAPVYLAALALLREEAGLPVDAATTLTRSDQLRLETGSQTHMVQVLTTYWSDLQTAFQQVLNATQDEPDQAGRAQIITAQLQQWARHRAAWKGEQIAVTEATDAASQAAEDFAVQNPAVFLRYRWHAVMDEDTCDACATLDGQVIAATQGPYPPLHPNCRCALHPIAREAVRQSESVQPVLT
jgi:SPP1 gp7 family putative phage head morphogenesis protein